VSEPVAIARSRRFRARPSLALRAAIAQGYTADLVTALSRDAAAKMNAALQRAFLGGQQLNDIIGQVGRALDANFTGSLFDSIGERASTIAMNEILRVHSIATQSRLEDLAGRHPGAEEGMEARQRRPRAARHAHRRRRPGRAGERSRSSSAAKT
jgi:hypothetical protein